METTDVVGYVRVSTAEQLDGFGLDVQEAGIRRFCDEHELTLVDIIREGARSGKGGIDQRPALAAALTLLDQGRAGGLVVYRLDRLARDLLLQETLIQRLRTNGSTVLSVQEEATNGEADPTRDLIRQVLGAISQYERALIAGRLAAGKAAKAAQGGYVGGQPRFGTAARDGALVALSCETETTDLIRRLRGEGLSYRAIATELDRRSVPTRKGGTWQSRVIHRIVSRDGDDGLSAVPTTDLSR